MTEDFDKTRKALAKKLATKEGVVKVSLVNVYGPWAVGVLRNMEAITQFYPKQVRDAKKRPQDRFVKGEKALPTEEEYKTAMTTLYTVPIEDLISDANSIVEDLAGQVREIVDNVQWTNLENTQRIQTLGETADCLEGIAAVELPDEVTELNLTVFAPPSVRGGDSRSDQLGEATGNYELAMNTLEEWMEENKEHAAFDAVSSVVDDLNTAIDEAGGAEFPGMYG